ncbi:hypothetical protein BTO15_06505 [Polaribacter sejongensis]|uniref:histidine kinase n=2 Tax=Polaribacter sejongensis TaxID=985043 RepID=A0ABM6PY86_9FLAO|nr:hypothetical protein BTO15_06505 [Polaribacter sejongensis]
MQGTLVALVILFLFHLRKQLGIGVMFACLGLFQFVQLFLYSRVSVSITDSFFVSPGSVVYFTASLFVILMVYIKEDASETKKLIYALFIVNIVMTILVQALNLHFNNTSIQGTYNASVNLFDISLRELFIGTIVLFLDAFLIILLFEYISKRVECLFLRICITMLIVVSFDTLFFVTLNFWGVDNLKSIIVSGLISKGVFTVFYSALLYFYLRFFDLNKQLTGVFKIKDVFEPLTYKQKFESAEKVIEETTEMYRILTDHSNDLIFLQEPDGAFKYISPSIKNILGYEQQDLVGKKVFSIVHKEDLKFLNEVLSKKLISRGVISEAIPVRVHHKEGHFVWLEFLSSPVYEGDEISYFVISARDITQRVLSKKKLQDSLEELEKKEHSLEEASKVAKIGYWEYDIKTETFTWSDYMYTIYGMDPVNGVPSQKELISLYDKESQEKIVQAVKDVAIKGVSCDVELRFVNKQNEVVWERTVAQSIYNEQNEVVGRIGIMQDITAFKKAQFEEELSKEKIQSSLELLEKKDYALNEVSRMAKIGYWEYNNEQVNIIWSDYHYDIFGFDSKKGIPPREEIVALFDEESQRKIVQVNLKLNSNGTPYDIELKLTNKKKEEIWVRNIVQPVFDKQNKVIGRRGLLQNITTSKKAQLALELSNEKIQNSLEELEKKDYSLNESSKMAKIGYWDYITAKDTYTWSDYIYYIYGLNPNEGIPPHKEAVKVCDKESLDKLLAATVELNTHGTPYNIVLKLINRNNEEVWVRNVAKPIYNKQNEIIGRRGVLQNISEWKKAQSELELSKEKIQSSLHLLEKRDHSLTESSRVAKIGHWEYDIATDSFVWSDYVYEIYGLALNEDIPTRKEMVAFYDKYSQLKLAKSTVDLTLKGTLYDIELKLINKKNKELWVRQVVHLVYNDKNEIIGRRGVVHNITAAKNAQIELEISKDEIQRSLELLEISEFSKNEASKMARIGYLEYDIATETFTWSEYIYHILGIDIKQPVPSRREIADFFDEESKVKMGEATLKLDTEGVSFDIELKLTNLRKEEVWIRIAVEPVYDQQNKIIKRRGVLQDITASKNVQLELEVSKEKIQKSLKLLESSEFSKSEASKMAKMGYLEDDIATETYIWSEYIYHIFGFDIKQPVPSREKIAELFNEESQEKMRKATFRLDTEGVPFDIELKLTNLRNEEVWIRIAVEPVYDQQNRIIKRRGVLQNITASKKAQLELELSKEEIQTSLKLSRIRKNSMNEASKVAKIGYWEHDLLTDTVVWSEYVHRIFGSNSENGIPSELELLKKMNKESQEKFVEATAALTISGISYDLELKFINLKEEVVWVRNVAQPIYNEQNEIVGKRGILQNITESKQAQQELELSKEKIENALKLLEKKEYSLRKASEIAKIGYQEYDNATDTFIWSDYVYDILRFDIKKGIPSREDVIAIFDDESVERYTKATQELIKNGTPLDCELKLVTNDKEEVWVRNFGQPVYNKQNEVIGRRGVLQDITASKKAQFELEVSKKNIQTSLELLEKSEYSKNEASNLAKIGYLEYDNATDTFVWSEFLFHIFGLDSKDPVPPLKDIINFLDKESQKKMKQVTLDLEQHGIPYDIELRLINKKKEEVWGRMIVQPLFNEQKEVIGRRGVFQDITASKEAQFALELSRENIQRSLELLESSEYSKNEASKMAKIGYLEYDVSTNTVKWSEYLYYIFGLDPKRAVPSLKEIIAFFDKDSQEKIRQVTFDLEFNGSPYDIELKLINKRNEEIWARMIVQPLFNEQKEVIGRRGVFQNITERKQIENENLIITERYRNLFDNATISVWNVDLSAVTEQLEELKKLKISNFRVYLEQHPEVFFSILKKVVINKVNKATVKLFKANSEKEFLEENMENTFGTGAHKVFAEFIISIWKKEKTFTSEVNYKTFKGDEFSALISIPIPLNLEQQKTVPVSIQSIQNIKDAESEKRESLNRLKEAQELAQVGSWSFDFSTKKSEWSDETFRIWDFDLNKPTLEQIDILNRIHKDDLDYFENAASLVYIKGMPYDIEFRICLPNNVEKTIRSICKPIFGKNKEVVSLKGTNQDITAQKKARSEIEKAEEMYRILTDNSNDLICLHEVDSTFKYISPSIHNLLGYEQSELLGTKVFGIVHKEDIKPLLKVMSERTFSNMYTDAFSCRVLHKEGHYVWLEFLSSPVYKDNMINSYISSARDITQWVLAKQEIEEYQSSLQKLTTEMTLIEEKQKKEIATNIHDHLSQSLVISKMKINELKKRPQLKLIDEDLKFIETHISEALENSRKITYELSPPVLYQLGIIEALSWLFDNVETTHKIACVVNSNVDNINLDEVKSILLYRSIQEVLTNAIKYADASLITLDLDKNKFGLDIFITDNGVGFDTSILNSLHNHSGSGFGLFTVQERIKNIQGKFTIKSKINMGTTVKIFIPLSK